MGLDRAIDITAEQRKTVLALLERHLPNTAAWVCGSHAQWTSRPQSDLDMVVFATPGQARRVSDLREAFEQNNLPFRVGLFVWDAVPEQFRKHIKRDHVVLAEEEKKEQSRPALNLDIADEVVPLREILAYTRDGEWGAGDINANLIPMRVIRGTDFEAVSRGSLANVPTRYIRPDVSERKTLKPWDILIETAGGSKNRPTGRTLLVHPRILERSKIPVTCASFTRFLRIHYNRADPAYVYWFLQYLYSIGEMEKHQVQHTGVARFQFTDFAANIEVPLPPLPEQRAIAHILGTLDDKIELNRRMNQTLEEMARALFKSWFVDFGPVRAKMAGRDPGLPKHLADLFPDRLVDSELGLIPEGWKVRPLDEIAVFQNGLALQKYRPQVNEERLPVVKIAQLRSRKTDSGEWATSNIRPEFIIDDGDVVFSWSGSLMVTVWCSGRAALNQHLFKVTSTRFPKWFFLHNVRFHLADFQTIAAGKATTMGHIKRHHLRDAMCTVPDRRLLAEADGPLSTILARSLSANIQSRTLASLRDTLLPELISGELRVKDTEQIARRAV